MDEREARDLLAFAGEAGRGLRGLDAEVWRQRIERRDEDLAAGFDWLLDHGRAAALYEQGMLTFWQGADEDACSLLGQSLHLARRLGDHTGVALALCGLARVALREDLEWAQALCEEALAEVAGTGDRRGRASALHVLGVTAQMRGDLPRARELMTARIAAARELGDLAAVGSESANLSMVERQLGDLAGADRLAREALGIAARRGDQWLIPYVLNGLAALAVEVGATERAATLLGSAAAMVERQGNAWPPDEAPHFRRSRAAAASALGPDRFQAAWSAGRHLSPDQAVSFALARLPAEAGVAS